MPLLPTSVLPSFYIEETPRFDADLTQHPGNDRTRLATRTVVCPFGSASPPSDLQTVVHKTSNSCLFVHNAARHHFSASSSWRRIRGLNFAVSRLRFRAGASPPGF